ncbi:hypothetical protein PDIDSM_767 [Penicillium digitatum]|nr:hypothetical protein PDIDSM_767 [Penicillium digitatum]
MTVLFSSISYSRHIYWVLDYPSAHATRDPRGAIGICNWYHRRMMERRRQSRYGITDEGTEDVELGGVLGHSRRDSEVMAPQESGVMSLEQEVDNWDENAVDNWDTEDAPGPEREAAPPSYHETGSVGSIPAVAKRID